MSERKTDRSPPVRDDRHPLRPPVRASRPARSARPWPVGDVAEPLVFLTQDEINDQFALEWAADVWAEADRMAREPLLMSDEYGSEYIEPAEDE